MKTIKIATAVTAALASALASASPCTDFSSDIHAWMTSGSHHVIRTVVTATLAPNVFEGFTFPSYSQPSGDIRFPLPGSLKSGSVSLRSLDGTQPAFDASLTLSLSETPSLAMRNLTVGARLIVAPIESCEYLSGPQVWRLVSRRTPEGRQVMLEMKFDQRPR